MKTSEFTRPDALAEALPSETNFAAILLFGSRARRDHTRGSDTDLLMVVPDGEPKHLSGDNFSIFLYSWPKLLTDAAEGDLFVCHLVHEAKSVFDPDDRLGQLRARFRVRANYSDLISDACDLGWFLERFSRQLNSGVVARRMIWCVRTILIAKSAEAGSPTFAPDALSRFSTSSAAPELLRARHQRKVDAALRTRFRRFLADECHNPTWHLQATMEEFVSRFSIRKNRVALQTLKQSEDFGAYR